MKPSTFIQKPAKWLEIINRHRATITAAPNFAFDRLCAVLEAEDKEGCDLSAGNTDLWRRAGPTEPTIAWLIPLALGLRRAAIAQLWPAEVMLLASSSPNNARLTFSDQNSAARLPIGPVVPACISAYNDTEKSADGQVGQIISSVRVSVL